MVTKRSLAHAEMENARPGRDNVKRTRLSPSADRRSDSSNLSRGSVSEDSALQSSDVGSEHQTASSVSSVESVDDDGEDTSSSGSSTVPARDSSDEETGSEDADQPVITIGGPNKPRIDHTSITGGAQDLRSRLAAFLPLMEKANGLLGKGDLMEKDEKSDGDDDEQHIEMNLGLGVLEEKKEDDQGEDSDSESSDDSDHSPGEQESEHPVEGANVKHNNGVMAKLLGQKTTGKPIGIEEIG